MRPVVIGSTNYSTILRILEGENPALDVLFDTADFALWYQVDAGAQVPIPLVGLADLQTAHVPGGFLAISNGYYRLDLPNLALAAGSVVELVGTLPGFTIEGVTLTLVAAPVTFSGEHAERQGYHPDPFDVWVPPEGTT